MYIEQLYTNCLAEAAYYIESEGEAVIIDPIREIEPYIKKLEERSAKLKYVLETHFHADFVSGHIDLANKTEAQIVYGPTAETGYKVHVAKDGEIFAVGKIRIKVLHTPGHTPESTCYLLMDENGKDHCVFTGDTLFVGDVGRPDLLDGKMTKEELAGMMYDSLNNKLKKLADDVIVYPAHGSGSSCGKNIGKEKWSTIAQQKQSNYALQEMSKEKFIEEITTGLSAPPPYFFKDAMINKSGYDNIEEVLQRNIKPLTVADVKKLMSENALVLDTRDASDFEKGFIKNSMNVGLNGTYAVWVGTLVDINTPLIIIADEGKEGEAILRLARVGYENVAGYLQGGVTAWKNEGNALETINSITPEAFVKRIAETKETILDVRKIGEYETSHIKNAEHVCLSKLVDELPSMDKSKTYLVHCAGGYRSMIAASMMKAQGFNNIVNVYEGFRKMEQVPGMPIESLSVA